MNELEWYYLITAIRQDFQKHGLAMLHLISKDFDLSTQTPNSLLRQHFKSAGIFTYLKLMVHNPAPII